MSQVAYLKGTDLVLQVHQYYTSPNGRSDPPQGKGGTGNVRANIPDSANTINKVPPNTRATKHSRLYYNVFLVHKASGGWCHVIDLKQLNAHPNKPHFYMFTINSVLRTEKSGDLCVQDRSGESVLPRTNLSKQLEYLLFAYKSKVYQFRVFSFGLSMVPKVFPRLGHTLAGYLQRQKISSPISRCLVSSPRPSRIALPPIQAANNAKDGGLQTKCSQIRDGTSSGYTVSVHSITSGSNLFCCFDKCPS